MRDSTADFENSTPVRTTGMPMPKRWRYRVALTGSVPRRYLGSTHPGHPEEVPECLAYCYDTPQEAYNQALIAGYSPAQIEVQRMVTWEVWVAVDPDVTGNWADAEFHGRSSR